MTKEFKVDEVLKEILSNALQESYVQSVIVHKIDNENSAIEMDYDTIVFAILQSLKDNDYEIIKLNQNTTFSSDA